MKTLQYTLLLLIAVGFLSYKHEVKPTPATEKTFVETRPPDTTKRWYIIQFAKQHMGIPYIYAQANPKKGFDCSGFVNYVYKHFNISVPRSSSGFKNLGRALKPSEFKVGDVLVFYGYRDKNSVGHVGIVCEANGMKSKFIHASSGKEMAVTVSELGSSQYTKRFYKCIDPLSL